MTNTMTAQHTPGPWWRDDDGFIAAGSGDAYVTIADPNCTHDLDIDEREANANLIAAAPDLLEALKDLLGDRPAVQGGICQHCGRDYIGEFLEGDCPSDDCPSFIAKAALAKATGQDDTAEAGRAA